MVLGLVLAVLALAAIVVVAWPWRVSLALRAQGDPGGAWAAGGGAQLSGGSISVAAARGTPVVVEVRLFGRRLLRRVIPDPAAKPKPALPEKKADDKPEPSAMDRYKRFSRWLDPIDLLLFLASERARITFDDLQGKVRLGLTDVALAGQIAGALAVLSALASPFGELDYALDWSGNEHLLVSISLSIRFTPALLGIDTARFLGRSLRLRNKASNDGAASGPKPPAPSEPSPAPAGA
jgi:hypothetical protein